MGAELSLSVKTISTYRTRVFEKLKFKSNADAVRYVAAERLLD
jgi:DNA-binding NarL/FixJ family response regulator